MNRIMEFLDRMVIHSEKYSRKENWTWDELTLTRTFLLVGFLLGICMGISLAGLVFG